jgi:hypothetical protein
VLITCPSEVSCTTSWPWNTTSALVPSGFKAMVVLSGVAATGKKGAVGLAVDVATSEPSSMPAVKAITLPFRLTEWQPPQSVGLAPLLGVMKGCALRAPNSSRSVPRSLVDQ